MLRYILHCMMSLSHLGLAHLKRISYRRPVAAVLDNMALEVCDHHDKAMRLGKNVETGMTKVVL